MNIQDRFYVSSIASDEYLTYLMTVNQMMFTDEIDCSDLFGGNSERERIMIFEIGQQIDLGHLNI